MTVENKIIFPHPQHGADIAPNAGLPAPDADPEHHKIDEHQVAMFSSTDPVYGENVAKESMHLHTQVYLEHGFITPEDLDSDGLYADEYSKRSQHLFVRNGTKVAAVRTIHAEKKTGIVSLPTAKNFAIDPDALCKVANVGHLTDIKPQHIIEISGLVARKQEGTSDSLDATLAMYTRLLRDSMESGHKVWLMNVEKGFLRYLNFALGRNQAVVLGEAKEYMGPATMPVAINPTETVRNILEADGIGSDKRREYIKSIFAGIKTENISSDMVALLKKHEVSVVDTSLAKRLLKHPKALWYAGVLALSTSRALPTVGVEEFTGNTAALWGIDVATAVPYAWGVAEALDRRKSTIKRMIGAVTGATCFAAPYVYFMAEGQDYPPYVNAVLGGLIGGAVLRETMLGAKERTLAHKLRKEETPPTSVDREIQPSTSFNSAAAS